MFLLDEIPRFETHILERSKDIAQEISRQVRNESLTSAKALASDVATLNIGLQQLKADNTTQTASLLKKMDGLQLQRFQERRKDEGHLEELSASLTDRIQSVQRQLLAAKEDIVNLRSLVEEVGTAGAMNSVPTTASLLASAYPRHETNPATASPFSSSLTRHPPIPSTAGRTGGTDLIKQIQSEVTAQIRALDIQQHQRNEQTLTKLRSELVGLINTQTAAEAEKAVSNRMEGTSKKSQKELENALKTEIETGLNTRIAKLEADFTASLQRAFTYTEPQLTFTQNPPQVQLRDSIAPSVGYIHSTISAPLPAPPVFPNRFGSHQSSSPITITDKLAELDGRIAHLSATQQNILSRLDAIEAQQQLFARQLKEQASSKQTYTRESPVELKQSELDNISPGGESQRGRKRGRSNKDGDRERKSRRTKQPLHENEDQRGSSSFSNIQSHIHTPSAVQQNLNDDADIDDADIEKDTDDLFRLNISKQPEFRMFLPPSPSPHQSDSKFALSTPSSGPIISQPQY